MDIYAKQALEEYNGSKMVRQGGVNGKGFWNINSTQFTFVPTFQFPTIPAAKEYIYSATDCNGTIHTFTAKKTTAPLTPIWKDIPTGMVELKVEALHPNNKTYLVGARTFFKCAPFPGRDVLPPKALSYKECAEKAFRYVFEDDMNQHWLTGKPKPDYYHNVYPSKMISSVVRSMIAYVKLAPDRKDTAMKIATNAADYLLSITYGADTKMEGIPPTYSYKDLDREIVDKNVSAVVDDSRTCKVMMIYPAPVGNMYLELYDATGNKKYYDAAIKIADYYKNNVLPNGSWYLLVNPITGEAESYNCCAAFSILEFIHNMYTRTKDPCLHTIEENYFRYLKEKRLEPYDWEGQFEDIALNGNYADLTHVDADNMIAYIAQNLSDDKEMVKEAEDLMRFVEDQFVVWDKFAPWGDSTTWDGSESQWTSPACLEQYFWYVPIDASAAAIIRAFLNVYRITKDKLLLEKAFALGDSITRMQNPETGVFPTHWVKTDCRENLENFWINCHIASAFTMMQLAELEEQ